MHIKLKRSHVIVAIVSLVLIFGYIAYRDLFFDVSAGTHEAVTTQIESLPEEKEPTAEYYGLRRAEIALEEYRKGVIEQPRGCNCGPEIDKYTEGTHAQWCTMFASWVGKEAGSGVFNHNTSSWKIVNSRDFSTYLDDNGTWFSREDVIKHGHTPRVGDYVVFWRGNFEDNLGHVDVVVGIDKTTGRADLIGGNLDDRIKYRENFAYLNNYGFLGFGRPEKE